jgi:structural maintenance of chromosome 1
MPSLASPGKILRLELENFKSYKGLQSIGPFYDFTAIIGPNGAGKSNLMDAISFVLGVRSGQLRGAQLKDLIYAYDDREKEQRGRRAFVRLVYLLANGSELHFTRTITSSGGSEYRVDGATVSWDVYNARLRELGILVKARNFLVFQVLFLKLCYLSLAFSILCVLVVFKCFFRVGNDNSIFLAFS